jgi:mono/diheme cytochrome c family protein
MLARTPMPHLSELHGAATHLAVIAIPLYAIVLLLRRAGVANGVLTAISPWVLGATLAGVALAGVTGLLVWGQAQTELRGSAFRIGSLHFWLGIALAVVVVVSVVLGWRAHRAGHELPRTELLAFGGVALVLVFVQGYIGGRMSYEHGVGVQDGGQYARTAVGASKLHVALAQGTDDVTAGRMAFSRAGLGCAACHGDQAQGDRGPRLAGGRELEDFRGVHGHGLFPAQVVTDRDFQAIDAYLKSLPGG